MKFLIAILILRFVIGLFTQKEKAMPEEDWFDESNNYRHPAEFELR